MKFIRALIGLVAVLLLVVGAAVAVLIGPDDTWGGDPAALPDSAPVVVTSPQLLNVAGVELAVTARAGDGEVFVGAAHPVHVQDYTGLVQRTEITALAADGVGASEPREGPREYPSVSPTELDIWDAQATGPDVTLRVPLTEDAPVQVAILPTTAKGAAPQVGIGYALPGAFVGGLVAAVVGLLLLVGTIVWGRRAKRARTNQATAPAPATGATAPSATSTMSRGATRIALVGVVGLVAAGCSIPQQVDHGQEPGLTPLVAEDAQAVLDDYDSRNIPAIKASHTGDGSLWKTADAGPLLAIDMVVARANALDKPKGTAKTFTSEAQEVFAPEQSSYPLWSVVQLSTSTATRGGAGLRVYTKEHASQPWRASSSVWVEQSLPKALTSGESTPTAEEVERGAQVDALLATWIEKGKVSGLKIDKNLTEQRAALQKKQKGVARQENSSDPWGVADDERTEQGGPVRVVRVDGGLLVMTDQQWTSRQYLEPNFVWELSDEEREVYGQRASDTVRIVDLALTAAIFVPDSGDAQVIGSSINRVRSFPR